MPVFIAMTGDPFRGRVVAACEEGLRVPQARILRALMPAYPEDSPSGWPMITRANLALCAGYSTVSGSVTRALNGIREYNKKSGDPHPGLIDRGLVECVELSIDGLNEINYRITHSGILVYQQYIQTHGDLPPLKDGTSCINNRYLFTDD